MSPPELIIRPAIPEDCVELLQLIAAHARYERSEAILGADTLHALLRADPSPVHLLVAQRGDALVGYAALTFDFSLWRGRFFAHLDCLYIAATMRGQSLGKALLDAARELARCSGADRLEWQTPDWNRRAIAFYEREGAIGQAKTRFALSLAE